MKEAGLGIHLFLQGNQSFLNVSLWKKRYTGECIIECRYLYTTRADLRRAFANDRNTEGTHPTMSTAAGAGAGAGSGTGLGSTHASGSGMPWKQTGCFCASKQGTNGEFAHGAHGARHPVSLRTLLAIQFPPNTQLEIPLPELDLITPYTQVSPWAASPVSSLPPPSPYFLFLLYAFSSFQTMAPTQMWISMRTRWLQRE